MRKRAASQWKKLGAAAGVLAVATASAGCGGSEAGATEEAEAYVKIVNVETVRLEPRSFAATVRITGEAEPATDVTVSAEEAGTLERFAASRGSRVARGGVIARIDDAVLEAQVEEARAMAEIARDRYERQRRLWEEEGIGSEIAYLEAKSDAEAAEARHRQLRTRLDRTAVRAPVAGTVDDHLVDAGEVVQSGTPVARIVNASRLEISGGVPERFAPRVALGDSAQITFDILPGRVFDGRISFVGTAVDRRSRTFPIEIVMDNPDGEVKPYMIANVRVLMRRVENAIVVPRDVLMRTEGGYQAIVVVEGERGPTAEARDVELGATSENEVVVTAGLEAGDRLVVRGHQMVDPGDRVRIVGGGE
ncbi:MAG: efflux RND transporter periplasmic adaptor subunit [Gemmatimonadota bacterium]